MATVLKLSSSTDIPSSGIISLHCRLFLLYRDLKTSILVLANIASSVSLIFFCFSVSGPSASLGLSNSFSLPDLLSFFAWLSGSPRHIRRHLFRASSTMSRMVWIMIWVWISVLPLLTWRSFLTRFWYMYAHSPQGWPQSGVPHQYWSTHPIVEVRALTSCSNWWNCLRTRLSQAPHQLLKLLFNQPSTSFLQVNYLPHLAMCFQPTFSFHFVQGDLLAHLRFLSQDATLGFLLGVQPPVFLWQPKKGLFFFEGMGWEVFRFLIPTK